MKPISDKFELDYRISQLREYAGDKLCRSAALEYLNFMVEDALSDLQGPNLDGARRLGDLDDASHARQLLRGASLNTNEAAAVELLVSLRLAINEIEFDDLGSRLLSDSILNAIELDFNKVLMWRLFSAKDESDRAADNRRRKQRKGVRKHNESRGLQKRNEQIFAWYKEISASTKWYVGPLRKRIAHEGRNHGFSDADLRLSERQIRAIVHKYLDSTEKTRQ